MVDPYAEDIKTAEELIAENGKDITWISVSESAKDGITGTVTKAEVEYPGIKAVVLPASKNRVQSLDTQLARNGIVYKRLSFLLIAGTSFTVEPKLTDKCIVEGDTWLVAGITPLNPNVGTPIKYDIALRI